MFPYTTNSANHCHAVTCSNILLPICTTTDGHGNIELFGIRDDYVQVVLDAIAHGEAAKAVRFPQTLRESHTLADQRDCVSGRRNVIRYIYSIR